ncbi:MULTISPECIES: pseudouridine synthase [unclassified Variovorax]|uniref:pseudouridine synthase n=1 Tax=unclassified Variovorax TaxID=663243 RepID=UPI001BD29D98|nr:MULTISPECIES: pseudouridine synthase [unclassified Variovorax]
MPIPPSTRPVAPLPTRDGVGPSVVALPEGDWPTMLDFLVERFPAIARSTWLERIAALTVVDERGEPVTPTRRYQPRLRLFYYRSLGREPELPEYETVLHQDAELVVVDKPHFMPVTPSGPYLQQSLLVRLKRALGIDALVPLHRIDRATAGLVLFSANPASRGQYQRLFIDRAMHKEYEAIVHWPSGATAPASYESRLLPDAHFMRTQEAPGEPNSQTHIELLEVRGQHGRLRLSPVTGRKHQLRVHCNALGMPIVNDEIYPVLKPFGPDDLARPMQLLARKLAFDDPLTGMAREFVSARSLTGWPVSP